MEINNRVRLPLYVKPDFAEVFKESVLGDCSFAEAISEGYIKVYYGIGGEMDEGCMLPKHTIVGTVNRLRYNSDERYVDFTVDTSSYYSNQLNELLGYLAPLYVTPVIWVNPIILARTRAFSFDSFEGFVICAVPSDIKEAHLPQDFIDFVRVAFDNRKETER